MPVIIPTGYAQVTIHGSCGDASGEVDNVFGISVADLDVELNILAADIGGFWMDDFGDFFHPGYTCTRVVVSEGPGFAEGEATINVSGAAAGDPAPMNVSALVKKNTGLAGRENRGRIYFGCLTEAYTTGSVLNAGGIAQLFGGLEPFLNNLTTEGTPMVILHSSASTPTPVLTLTVEARLATQRGRLRD